MVIPLGELRRTRIVPVVTYLLIAINVTVFLVQQERGEEFTRAFAMTPREVTQNEDLHGQVPRRIPVLVRDAFGDIHVEMRQEDLEHHRCPIPVRWTLLTSMFLHGSWIHLLGNMLYLWVFGDDVEEVLGPLRYIIVYLACGLVGALTQIAANPQSDVPTVGASGAIAGIMGAYVVWFPHNPIRVLLFRFITLLPASIVIGGWIGLQVWMGAGTFHRGGDEGGVAYLAHVGGALTGLFVAFLFADQARYIKARNAAAEGWTIYEDPESP
jgi:membrane associated rhomboid family serine protease